MTSVVTSLASFEIVKFLKIALKLFVKKLKPIKIYIKRVTEVNASCLCGRKQKKFKTGRKVLLQTFVRISVKIRQDHKFSGLT